MKKTIGFDIEVDDSLVQCSEQCNFIILNLYPHCNLFKASLIKTETGFKRCNQCLSAQDEFDKKIHKSS